MNTIKKETIIFKIQKRIEKFLQFILGVLLSAMSTLVFANVVFRYGLNFSIAWSEEISRFMMIWIGFIGLVVAYIHNDHLGIDLLIKAIPKKTGQIVTALGDLLVLFATIVITHGGFQLTLDGMTWTSPAVSLPYGVVFAIVPLTGCLLIFAICIKLREHLLQLIHHNNNN